MPNPFNPGTEFQFDLPHEGEVEIRIYSLRGERVRTVRGGVMTEGPETLRWEGRNDSGAAVASGAYIYRLYLDGNIKGGSRKMSLIR